VRNIELKRFEGESADTNLSPQDKFCIGVFLASIDSMTGALKKRLDAYTLARNILGFFEIFDLTPESIRESSNRLLEAYLEDLEYDLADELLQFCSFTRSSSGLKQENDKVSFDLLLYRISSEPGVREAFPSINSALQIYLSRLVTNSIAQESGHFL